MRSGYSSVSGSGFRVMLGSGFSVCKAEAPKPYTLNPKPYPAFGVQMRSFMKLFNLNPKP